MWGRRGWAGGARRTRGAKGTGPLRSQGVIDYNEAMDKQQKWTVRKQRLIYFLAGLLGMFSCIEITDHARFLRPFENFILFFPWIGLAILVSLRVRGRTTVRYGTYLAGILFAWVAFIGNIIFGPSVEYFFVQENFDAVIWRQEGVAPSDGDWPPRLCMAEDLISSGHLTGLKKAAVFDLIGEPRAGNYRFGEPDSSLVYYLGPERGFIRIDSEWLVVSFDDQGVVKKVRLARD